jgi:hypothetical protein
MSSPEWIFSISPFLARLYRRFIVRYLWEEQGKCDDAKSIWDEHMTWFYTGSGSPKNKSPISIKALLIYGFSLPIPIPLMEFGLLLLYSENSPYRYGKFPTLLQLTQARIKSELLLRPHPASWDIADNGPPARAVFEVSSIWILFSYFFESSRTFLSSDLSYILIFLWLTIHHYF